MSIFVTSDLHFNHNKDFLYSPRGFETIEAHDETIIKNWNEIVSHDDTVYVLGDLSMGTDLEMIKEKIKSLNGTIHILIGNHDTNTKCATYMQCKNVKSCQYATIVKSGKWSFYLSHRPTIMTSDICLGDRMDKSICLHGHTHSKDKFEYVKNACYNVALDAQNNRPVNLEDVKNEMRDKMIEIRNQASKENKN